MPQMAPMNWMMILLYTLSLFLLVSIWMTYLFSILNSSDEAGVKLNYSSEWKW